MPSAATRRQERAAIHAAELLRALPPSVARIFEGQPMPTPREIAGAGDGHGCEDALCVAVVGLVVLAADAARRSGRRVPPWVAIDIMHRLNKRPRALPGVSSREAVAEWLGLVFWPLTRHI